MNKVVIYNNYFKDEILKVLEVNTIEAVPLVEQAIRTGLDVIFISKNSMEDKI